MSPSDATNTLGATPQTQAAPQRTAPAAVTERQRAVPTDDTPAAKVEAPFPDRAIALRIDEATQIVQTLVRDDATGKLLRELPDDQWLRLVVKLRAFAAEAILDKSV